MRKWEKLKSVATEFEGDMQHKHLQKAARSDSQLYFDSRLFIELLTLAGWGLNWSWLILPLPYSKRFGRHTLYMNKNKVESYVTAVTAHSCG